MPISIVSQVWSWIWLSREEWEKIMHAFTPEQSSRAHQMCVNGHPNTHACLKIVSDAHSHIMHITLRCFAVQFSSIQYVDSQSAPAFTVAQRMTWSMNWA